MDLELQQYCKYQCLIAVPGPRPVPVPSPVPEEEDQYHSYDMVPCRTFNCTLL
ncbi:GD24631 [Drosophila simulans]|uniref:GD24631 n=1 Tax=Drosophila simulans TaxID=7240 RepID=B4NTV8_DROSI|nr:GD24631 [Drosophila simulans]